MKTKSLVAGLGLAALALVQGCATVEISSRDALAGVAIKGADGEVAEHVVLDTWGYYILWTLPICSGELRWDDETNSIKGDFAFFSDMVGITELQTALLKLAESRNCNLVDVSFSDTDASYADLASGDLLGALFGESHMVVSATLVPRK